MAELQHTEAGKQPAPKQVERARALVAEQPAALVQRALVPTYHGKRIDSRRLTPGAILALQRTAGNTAVNRLLTRTTGSALAPLHSDSLVPTIQRVKFQQLNAGNDDFIKRTDAFRERFKVRQKVNIATVYFKVDSMIEGSVTMKSDPESGMHAELLALEDAFAKFPALRKKVDPDYASPPGEPFLPRITRIYSELIICYSPHAVSGVTAGDGDTEMEFHFKDCRKILQEQLHDNVVVYWRFGKGVELGAHIESLKM